MLPNPPVISERYRTANERNALLEGVAASNSHIRRVDVGRSEGGRDIRGVVIGEGPFSVSLVAGAHSDEPVGPETLTCLVEALSGWEGLPKLADRVRLLVIPHVNPDGEAANRSWIDAWPDLQAYLTGVSRELPGRDIEFSYPDGRIENSQVSKQLGSIAPIALHMSLHGMGYSDGAMLLIDRFWGFRAHGLRSGFRAAAARQGLRMHDHNRMGEKGFFQIEPGYTTTPEGSAMRTYFNSRGDQATAALFRDSSMEFVQKLGGDPLCVVTELPLFLVDGPREPGRPTGYMRFRALMAEWRTRLQEGAPIAELEDSLPADLSVRPLPLSTAVGLQWNAIELALREVMASVTD